LNEGLSKELPDLTERINHILTKQVFGIGITELTSLLARRSVYCSKYANGIHSVAQTFTNNDGNIWFERTEHTWVNGKCKFCGASKAEYARTKELETHAYAFIHTENIKSQPTKIFGVNMRFDVIIGNPPYQLSNGESSDIPIYQHFVSQAKKLEPKYLSMVIPARWMAGGKGLDDFRAEMLGDRRISCIVDFRVSKEVFQSVEIKGGICYFLWDNGHSGECRVTTVRGNIETTSLRELDEFDVFVRDPEAAEILRKVVMRGESSITDLVSGQTPFGLVTNFSQYHTKKNPGDIGLHYNRAGKREMAFVRRDKVAKGLDLIDHWKLLAPMAGSDGGQKIPDVVVGQPLIAKPGEVCTQTYLAIGPFQSLSEVKSFETYYRTKFFRFLLSMRKITQHAGRATYTWIPMQKWDRNWTDKELFEKYGISSNEIAFIESMIQPMELDGE
jgi:site-specific DNA-methyltransferase (adenine-specific)